MSYKTTITFFQNVLDGVDFGKIVFKNCFLSTKLRFNAYIWLLQTFWLMIVIINNSIFSLTLNSQWAKKISKVAFSFIFTIFLIDFHALYDLELWKHAKLFLSADVLNLTFTQFFKHISFHVSFYVKFGNTGCCDSSINNPPNSCLVTLLLMWNITFWVKYSIKKSGDCLFSTLNGWRLKFDIVCSQSWMVSTANICCCTDQEFWKKNDEVTSAI